MNREYWRNALITVGRIEVSINGYDFNVIFIMNKFDHY